MPYLWALTQDRNFSCAMNIPDASKKDGQAAPRPWSVDSVFIMLSAKAYSSVGFGLSLLAIWVSWALPKSAMPTLPLIESSADTTTRKGHRRTRSAGHKLKPKTSPKPLRRLSAPLPLPGAPIYGVQPDATRPGPSRHVSFADSPPSTSRQNSHEAVLPSTPPADSQLFSTTVTTSPLSSNASLSPPVHLPTPPPEEELQRCNSDSSRLSATPSTKTSTPVFRKLRLSFKSKRKGSTDKSPELPRTPELEKDVPVDCPPASSGPRKHSFIPPWSHSKKTAPTDPLACLETASTRSSCSLSKQSTSSKGSSTASPTSAFTLLPKKPTRRTTTPIPRTMPYEAPYFATPPQHPDDSSYTSYLRRLPQFEDDMPASSDASNEGSGARGREVAAQESRSLGTSSRTRPTPKRRSASENWSSRQGTSAS